MGPIIPERKILYKTQNVREGVSFGLRLNTFLLGFSERTGGGGGLPCMHGSLDIRLRWECFPGGDSRGGDVTTHMYIVIFCTHGYKQGHGSLKKNLKPIKNIFYKVVCSKRTPVIS